MKDKKYKQTKSPINSNITTVQDYQGNWGAIDNQGNVIVPFGKYEWIDGFQNGLARVIAFEKEDKEKPKDGSYLSRMKSFGCGTNGGIINEDGEEVLPTKYDVWRFYGKNYPTIRYSTDKKKYCVRYESLNPSLFSHRDNYDRDDYETRYGKYEGSYAQDVEGYTDEMIDDAFDGEPDAYWNID